MSLFTFPAGTVHDSPLIVPQVLRNVAVPYRQREAVVDAMRHAWSSYVTYAWGHDELDPIGKRGKDGFGGVGATVPSPSQTLSIP